MTIDLKHYNYQYRVILKDSFTGLLKKVFNEELKQIDFLNDLQIRFRIIELINSLKELNTYDTRKVKK